MPVEAGQVVPPLSPRSHSTSVVLPGCFSTCSPWSICSRTCPGSFTRKCTMERQAGQEDNCQVQILQQVLSISESRLPKMGWSFVSESRGALGSCEVKWSCLWYQRGLEDPVQICYCTAGLFWILSGNHTGVGSAHAPIYMQMVLCLCHIPSVWGLSERQESLWDTAQGRFSLISEEAACFLPKPPRM